VGEPGGSGRGECERGAINNRVNPVPVFPYETKKHSPNAGARANTGARVNPGVAPSSRWLKVLGVPKLFETAFS